MKRPGLTLVEALVGIFVLGIVIAVVLNIYIATGTVASREQLRTRVGAEASRVLNSLDGLLREGKSIEAQYPTSGTAEYVTDTDTIVFSIPSALSNGTLSGTQNDTVIIDYEPANRVITARTIPNAAAPSTRTAATAVAAADVADMYIRYAADVPTDATAVTITVATEKTERDTTSRTMSILYGVFRNRP